MMFISLDILLKTNFSLGAYAERGGADFSNYERGEGEKGILVGISNAITYTPSPPWTYNSFPPPFQNLESAP